MFTLFRFALIHIGTFWPVRHLLFYNHSFVFVAKIRIKKAENKLTGTDFVERIRQKGDIDMAFIDYYKIMGIPKDTPQKDIKTAYKKRAKQFHPDLHPDDPKAKAKFQALNEAYDVLNDPEKRAKYDQYGEHWKQAEAFDSAAQGNSTEGFDFSQFGNSGFSEFFEQLFGGPKNSRRTTTQGHSGFNGFSSFNGFGNFENTDNYQTAYTDHEYKVDIDMYTALLGGEILIQTPKEKLKLKIKPGTQPGSKVRLKGKGDQYPDGTRGNLILVFNVTLPKQLSERQKELLEQMRHA